LPHFEDEYQLSVNDLWSCIFHNPRAVQWQYHLIEVLAILMGKIIWENDAST
jgi:hypothetical protein